MGLGVPEYDGGTRSSQKGGGVALLMFYRKMRMLKMHEECYIIMVVRVECLTTHIVMEKET